MDTANASADAGGWQQPKQRHRRSSRRSERVSSTARDGHSLQLQRLKAVAADSAWFKELTKEERERRIVTVVAAIRRHSDAIATTPVFLSLCGAVSLWLQSRPSRSCSSVDVVCYGVGRFCHSRSSALQLACLLSLRARLQLHGDLCIFDPLMSEWEDAVAARCGLRLLSCNEEGKRRIGRPSIAFMPHCCQALYNNLLWANWGWRRPHTRREADEPQQQEDVAAGLQSFHLSDLRTADGDDGRLSQSPLSDLLIIGNSLNSHQAGRRRSSSSCPVHAAAATTPPPLPPLPAAAAASCTYHCICVAATLGLLREARLDAVLETCEDDELRLALHDTTVQWLETETGRETGRDREGTQPDCIARWLSFEMPEPRIAADDPEMVLREPTER